MLKSFLKERLIKTLREGFYWSAKRTTGWRLHYSKKLKLNLLLNVDNFIDFIIFKYGIFEQDVLNSLVNHIDIEKRVLFIDIGAHLGQMSLYIAKQFPNTKVIAFEPESNTFAQHAACKLINSLHYELHQFAIGDNSDTKLLYVPQEKVIEEYWKFNNGMATLTEKEDGYNKSSNLVTVIPLDDFLAKRINLDEYETVIIKIDVEGFELAVLQGAMSLLQSKDKIIIVLELLVKENKDNAIQSFKLLKSLGYDAFNLNGQPIVNEKYLCEDNSNYLFKKVIAQEY